MTTLETPNLDLDLLRQKSKDSFYFFAKGILGFDWLVPHIHLPVCLDLEELTKLHYEGGGLPRGCFVLPRGWLKTTICSQAWPMWMAVHDPNIRILLAQNNRDNARAKTRVIREQFEGNNLLRAMYPEVLPTRSSIWTADSLCLNRPKSFPEGTFDCLGVKGQATSRHYNVIIQDDTVAPDLDELGGEMLAPTHDDVRKAISWHKLTLPLLTNPSNDIILVVGTRWYQYDLISHIQTKEPQYHITTRACREDEDGNPDPKGHITYPERFDDEVLLSYENTLGPYFFSTLMMNNPVSEGDMVFKMDWVKEYETLPPRQSLVVWTTMDPATDPELAVSRAEDIDYSTIVTTGKDLITGFIYVLDYFRAKCSPGDHAAALFDQVLKWNPIEVGYENVAYQKSLDYWLKEMMRQEQKYFILKPVKRTGKKSKETHIMGLQPLFASGTIFTRSWMTELVSELLTFPRGKHDDLIDALAMHLQFWRTTKRVQKRRKVLDPYGNDLESILEQLKEKAKARSGHTTPVSAVLNASPTRDVSPLRIFHN